MTTFDFSNLMRYTTALRNYKPHHNSQQAIGEIQALGEEWWEAGLWLYSYSETLEWLYSRYTPHQLAALSYELQRNRWLLQDGKDSLRGAISLIVNNPEQAAMSLPEAKWETEGVQCGAIYPDRFYVRIREMKYKPAEVYTTYHIFIDGNGNLYVPAEPEIRGNVLEEIVRQLKAI